MASSYGDINAADTVFLMCDMQVKLIPAMCHSEDIITVTERMIEGSKILNIPLIVTEQILLRSSPPKNEARHLRETTDQPLLLKKLTRYYPEGLGHTIPQLNIKDASIFPKKTFTMFIPEIENALKKAKHAILFGIEAHICILQTVIDLLKNDIQVHVVADACTSRSLMDRLFAFERFRQMGAFVTTSESILFQLIKSKDHEKFKQIQQLIKVCAPTSGLIPEQKL